MAEKLGNKATGQSTEISLFTFTIITERGRSDSLDREFLLQSVPLHECKQKIRDLSTIDKEIAKTNKQKKLFTKGSLYECAHIKYYPRVQ